MKFDLSRENRKRALGSVKWTANAGQNYLKSLSSNSSRSTSSAKRLMNAFLLVPIIVPHTRQVKEIKV